MNKLLPVIVVVLLAGLAALSLGFVPAGDPRPMAFEATLSAGTPADAGASPSATFETPAKQLIVVDAETGAVMFDKDAATAMPTSSMSKVMTLYMVFDALKAKRISLSDTFTISEKAWRMEGSKMFIQVGSQVAVEDLIRGVAIQSGNDAAVALAEGLAGSEEDFAAAMNARAKEIGMNNSHFANASGWPDPDHYSTAQDLAILAFRIINDHPEYYHYFSEREFSYNNITQQNRDPLLGRLQGADGLKTGHTDAAGFGLIGSAERNGRRVIMVVNGLDSIKARSDESVRIMEWAFRNFELKTIFGKGQDVARAPVWLGDAAYVPLVAEKDIKVLVPRSGAGEAAIRIVYDTPAYAPVAAGDKLGMLSVTLPGGAKHDVALLAGKDVARAGFMGRVRARIANLLGRGPEAEASADVVAEGEAVPAAADAAPAIEAAPVVTETAPEAEADADAETVTDALTEGEAEEPVASEPAPAE